MKLIGIVLLLFSGGGCCLIVISELDRRIKNLRALCELLRVTGRMVDSFSMSARDILKRLPDELVRDCGCSADVRPESFPELACACEISDDEAKRVFGEFAYAFGKSYRQEQVRQCEYYLDRMCERESEVTQKLHVQKKLAVALSLSATLALVMLLI
ncbi:MAG: hypothetical protein J6L85_00875 [Clostridia bacterium]|nr:hypothetical protein [Clostridia bacterium]